MESVLVLVRHGESEWNAKNVWTGLTDIGLTDKGRAEARLAAEKIRDIHFDRAYTSALMRAQETLSIMLGVLGLKNLPVARDRALNERDYGVYTGKNKLEIKNELGEQRFLALRRGWDFPVPEGESLKQVYARVVPYFEQIILPQLTQGQHVLIVAHGNSLRALMKKLDDISDESIAQVELATGAPVVYHTDGEGRVLSRDVR